MGCCWSDDSIKNIKNDEDKIIIDIMEINHGMSSNVFKSMTLIRYVNM